MLTSRNSPERRALDGPESEGTVLAVPKGGRLRFRSGCRSWGLLTVLFVGLYIGSGWACGLVEHDWQTLAMVKVTSPFPLFPWAEMDELCRHIPLGSIERLVWVMPGFSGADPWVWTRPFLPGWLQGLPWEVIASGGSLLQVIRARPASAPASLVLGIDQVDLGLAIFADRNSAFRCRQILLFQESRLRAVIPPPGVTWAEEIHARAWISLIFFDFPWFDRILFLAAFPLRGLRWSWLEDPLLVTRLISGGLLKGRAQVAPTPQTEDFPSPWR